MGAAITPEEERRQWAAMTERLTAEVTRRGGEVYPGPVWVQLASPNVYDQGIQIRRFDEEGAEIRAGLFLKVVETWRGDEDTYIGIYDTINAIIDGGAEEVVEIGPDGVWIGAYTTITYPPASGRGPWRSQRLLHSDDLKPDHTHTRQISAWPSP
jgi:hypothetical protein